MTHIYMIVGQVVVRDREGISDTMLGKHKSTEGREKGDGIFFCESCKSGDIFDWLSSYLRARGK